MSTFLAGLLSYIDAAIYPDPKLISFAVFAASRTSCSAQRTRARWLSPRLQGSLFRSVEHDHRAVFTHRSLRQNPGEVDVQVEKLRQI